eukprot:TRINITY_DN1815_c0_g1_i1.p1 TRINITY_DN1815_c0_g1~~TRINITY_DN1815_c0_g1_i1.p1  ORF type:complete len:127 (-),score=56.35 TRINITY_DN1815_c0_g1_i1:55-435(-)
MSIIRVARRKQMRLLTEDEVFNRLLGKERYSGGGGFLEEMDIREASKILGLDGELGSEGEIIKQHKKLLLMNHPDKGGSTYMSTKINEAKEMLLKEAQRMNSREGPSYKKPQSSSSSSSPPPPPNE